MYIVFGNEIINSSEIKDIIENNSDFNVEKDLTKGSKREDTLAYQISIDVALLNEVIKESYELDSIDEEELFDEYMNKMMILHNCIYNAGARTKIRLNHVKKKYIKDDKRWKKYNKQHLFKIITSLRVSLYRKLLIFASCYFINTLTILEKIRRRKIIRRSVS